MDAPDGTGTRVTVALAGPLDGAGLDALARIAVLAGRLGWQLEVRSAGPELDPLLRLAGLLGVLTVPPGRG